MNLNLPLILAVLVFGSGFVWLVDTLTTGRRRRQLIGEYQQRYPQWSDASSDDGKAFRSLVSENASEPTIVEYARSFFPVLAAVFVLRSFLFEPFQIPSSSMVPTLEVGDYILVNKFTYGLRAPVLREKFVDIGEPERGDVMVFFPPHENNTYYIKRVIGLPGDTIEYRRKQLYVNGEAIPQEWVSSIPHRGGRSQVGIEQVGADSHLMQVELARPSRNFSVQVKPGHYFMMGDNRDNSSDSRVWGQVPESDIVGKAVAVWMHWESFFSIPSFDRVGWIR